MDSIKSTNPGKNKEIQLTDAINNLIFNEECEFNAVISNSQIFDCGSKEGFLNANIAFSLKDKDLKKYYKEKSEKIAQVVELVDTRDLKSLEGDFVPVQVRPWVPKNQIF